MSTKNDDDGENFCVVEFDDGVMTVPELWLNKRNSTCWYPTHWDSNRILKAIRKPDPVGKTWKSMKYLKLYGTYSTYEIAHKKARKAEYQTDLETTDHETSKRARRVNAKRKLSTSDSNISDCDQEQDLSYPQPPDADDHRDRSSPVLSHKRSRSSERNHLDSPDQPAITNRHRIVDKAVSTRPKTSTYKPSMEREYNGPSKNRDNIRDQRLSSRIVTTRGENTDYDNLAEVKWDIWLLKQDMRKCLELPQCLVDNSEASVEQPSTCDIGSIENMIPLQTVADVQAMENFLATPANEAKMLKYCVSIGGRTLDEAAKRICIRVFTNAAAREYSWEGRKGKNKLCSLQLMRVIYTAITRMSTVGVSADKQKFEERVKDWFRHSNARLKNEQERADRLN